MNLKSARGVSEFVTVLEQDSQGRPVLLSVPGHNGQVYHVTLSRDSFRLWVTCMDADGYACKGNRRSICYHALAAVFKTAKNAEKSVAVCLNRRAADKLANLGGKIMTVSSTQSGWSVWFVVREGLRPKQDDSLVQKARRYLELRTEYHQNPRLAVDNPEYKDLATTFASLRWNESMVQKFVRETDG